MIGRRGERGGAGADTRHPGYDLAACHHVSTPVLVLLATVTVVGAWRGDPVPTAGLVTVAAALAGWAVAVVAEFAYLRLLRRRNLRRARQIAPDLAPLLGRHHWSSELMPLAVLLGPRVLWLGIWLLVAAARYDPSTADRLRSTGWLAVAVGLVLSVALANLMMALGRRRARRMLETGR